MISNVFADVSYLRGYTKSDANAAITNNQTNTARFITFTPTIGIGFGRIRNVSPMIRALRLNERYKELGNPSFSESEIKNTADTFTKVQGYQRTRDRFLKDFWRDINSNVNSKLDATSTFDMFYLNDVLSENLGSRFEGYEVSLTLDYSYLNQLRKEDDRFNDFKDRDFVIRREVNVNLNYDWFKNLNLYHQISIVATNQLILPLERENDENFGNFTSLTGEWLWNFADRFQFTTTLSNNLLKINFKESELDDLVNFNSQLRSNLIYFIENKLALNAGFSISYDRLTRGFDTASIFDQQLRWSLNVGASYYFNRNLY